AGLVVYPLCSKLMEWLKLDDPVDAVPVHGGCGLFGVLAVAFCIPDCSELRLSGSLTKSQSSFCSADHRIELQLLSQVWACVV
ncbi:unnamed protein product, partial [Polarella glacialis]